MTRSPSFILFLFCFCLSYSLPAQSNDVLKVTAGAATATLSLLIVSLVLYRNKTQWFSELPVASLTADEINKLKLKTAYQVVGSTRLDPKRKGMLAKIQDEIFIMDHPDFHQSTKALHDKAFFDPESGLVARVFMTISGDVVMVFRGSEKYSDRLKRYAVPNYKAIEWAEEVFNTFGNRPHYTFVGHCAGGGHAILAGFSIYRASGYQLAISVVGFNSSMPSIRDFYMMSKDKKQIKVYLKNCVDIYQDVNDPVFRFAGIFLPFSQSMRWNNWYNWDSEIRKSLKLRLVNLPQDFTVVDPLAKRERRNFYMDFSFTHQVRSVDTWGHSAVKWLSWFLQNDVNVQQKIQ